MFNWPVKFREETEFCVPKGPYFDFSEQISFSVGGTKISLRSPRHSYGSNLEPIRPYSIESVDNLRLLPWSQDKDEWLYHNFFRRQWRFYGPWFSGYKGNLTLDISLITLSEESEEVSYYRPKAFESVISDYLKLVYADDLCEGGQQIHAPVDWKAINDWSCVAATFYAQPNDEVSSHHSPSRYVVFPVSSRHLIRMRFDLRRSSAGTQVEQDAVIGLTEIERLSTDIINSIQIKLSPEALAQQAEALEGIENVQLSETFPPIKFTTAEQDAEYQKYLQDERRGEEILKGK